MIKESEDKIQSDCYVWFHNTYPELRGLLCYNLNNSKNKVDGARNKAMGLQASRSDFSFYYMGKTRFIEMKTPEGNQSPGQVEWEMLVSDHGFDYYICRSLAEFQSLIFAILK